MPQNRTPEEPWGERLRPPRHLSDDWLHAGPVAVEAQAEGEWAAHAQPVGSGRDGAAAPPVAWGRGLCAALLLAVLGLAAWQPEAPVATSPERPVSACPPASGSAPVDRREHV
jgi:hypothetical protein